MVLDLTKEILEPRGYVVRPFRDPIQALEAFTAADPKPDLVVTDYAMGTMTGMELIQACRKVRPEQKILLVSGTVGPEICGEGDVGPDAFMAKPFEVNALADVVWRLTHTR